MSNSKRIVAVAAMALAACSWMALSSSHAKDEPGSQKPDAQKKAEKQEKADSQEKPSVKKTAMKAFMRKKLAASQEILEGLAIEDYDLIENGAKQLKAMSVAAEFMVLNDPMYDEFAGDFRRTVSKMEKAAREKRIDGSTLAYMDTTMNCVECHKYVRTILIAK